MEDTRTNRKKREKIIIKCLKELASLELPIGESYQYHIETWTKDDVEPTIIGKNGIRVTMFW